MESLIFYAAIVCFALSLITYSLDVLVKSASFGMLTSGLYMLGLLALFVCMIVNIHDSEIAEPIVFIRVVLTAFTVMSLYAHLRMANTMVLPLSALAIIAFGLVSLRTSFLSLLAVPPVLVETSFTWGMSLAAIGNGFFCAAVLFFISLSWRSRTKEGEHDSIRTVALVMPRVIHRLGWVTFITLTLALTFYSMWCSDVAGVLWVWQPLMSIAACAWLILACGCFLRIHL